MYFDRILFGAAFATIVATAVLGAAQRVTTPADIAQAPAAEVQTLERVVVVGQREPNGI